MNDFVKNLGASIESINNKALDYAMIDICGEYVDSASQEWQDHCDDIIALQSEYFDDDINDWLKGCMEETGMSAQQVVECLKQHHERLSDIIGGAYIDAWYENFIDNFEVETAE